MPHYPPKVEYHQVAVAGSDFSPSFDDLSVDELANILGFLSLNDIMCKRGINKKTTEAVKMTIVPLGCSFCVNGVKEYNAMDVMTRAMPNLQQLRISRLGVNNHKFSDGEDPDEELASDRPTHDIAIISSFRKLHSLALYNVGLNGRYPALFNFPLLQKLSIHWCRFLEWDLEMLAGLPSLKELDCFKNSCMDGNISSLRVLKDTLEKIRISNCWAVKGNFMYLADFPNLKELNLYRTAVTGDIRDIDENHFSSLEDVELPMTVHGARGPKLQRIAGLTLPHGVYGGSGYEFQHISDGTELVRAVYLLKKQRPNLFGDCWYCRLSDNSPDWYESADEDDDEYLPPFSMRLVEAGSRIGYRWTALSGRNPCEVNWFDPEPDRESSDYEKYIAESQKIDGQVNFYSGFFQPPTEEEYGRLYQEFFGDD